MATTRESIEQLGKVADTLDNLYHALMLPLSPATHIEYMKAALPEAVANLRAVYVAETGSDPWAALPA